MKKWWRHTETFLQRLPPLPLAIALVPLNCSSRNLHRIGCPLPKKKSLGALALSKTKHTALITLKTHALYWLKLSVGIFCMEQFNQYNAFSLRRYRYHFRYRCRVTWSSSFFLFLIEGSRVKVYSAQPLTDSVGV
jgi:hypothetical protein